jgi:hypothetical protein
MQMGPEKSIRTDNSRLRLAAINHPHIEIPSGCGIITSMAALSCCHSMMCIPGPFESDIVQISMMDKTGIQAVYNGSRCSDPT